MPQENVAVVLRNLETSEHDEEAWLSTVDPALEWHPIEEGHSLSRGHEGAIRVRGSWLENWEGHQIDVEEMHDGADSVVDRGSRAAPLYRNSFARKARADLRR